jgi:hypothetical protein
VASHFLTPEGHVIHSVTGPVSASVLLEEARWAVDLYAQVMDKSRLRQRQFSAAAHQRALQTPRSSQDRKVHRLLMNRPLPSLQLVYEEIFEDILGQKVSDAGPRLAKASKRIEQAKRSGRPILFVMHDQGRWIAPPIPLARQQLMNEYAVIVMTLRDAPALSQLTGQPPFESSGSSRPLLVVARSDCQQLASVAGWNTAALNAALSAGWIDALERNPPSVGRLVRAQRLLRKVSPADADRARELTIRVREERLRPKKEKADEF